MPLTKARKHKTIKECYLSTPNKPQITVRVAPFHGRGECERTIMLHDVDYAIEKFGWPVATWLFFIRGDGVSKLTPYITQFGVVM